MNELIEKVKQWGIDKGITGPNGKGTLLGQAKKMREECDETFDAANIVYFTYGLPGESSPHHEHELLDGIGDSAVTLILLAELAGLTFQECLQHAYDEIKGRVGVMKDGTFVREK